MKRWLLAVLALSAVLLPSGVPIVSAATPTPAPTMQIGSTFPGAVDDGLCDPTPTAATNNPSCPASQLQADQNDAIQAVERKVGTGASTPSAGTYLGGTGDGTSAYEAFPAAPTPAPTETPAPTATPRPTDTPIPAPTLFPTVAAGVVLGGTGAQGVQAISNIPGTLTTAAQPNITSVGVLASPHMTSPVVDSGTMAVGASGVNLNTYAMQVQGNTTGSNSKGMQILAGTNSSDFALNIQNAGNTQGLALVWGDGGLSLGNATGNSKGLGTINVASAIYLNGTAYTNPDYVLERWATGRIVRYADKPGANAYEPLTLPQMEAYARENWALPGFGQAADNDLFSGSDQLLARVEDGYRYLFDHEERLRALTAGEVGLGLLSMLLAGAFLVERRTLLRRIEALEVKR